MSRELVEVSGRGDERRRAEVHRRLLGSPWISGSFYVSAVVLILAVVAIVANAVPAWTLPLVLVSAVLALVVVGMLQLRTDDRLSEESFVALAKDVVRELPGLATNRRDGASP